MVQIVKRLKLKQQNDYFLKDEKNNNHAHVAHVWQPYKSTK